MPSSSYCVMLYFWWGCRRNLKLITLESERVKLLVGKIDQKRVKTNPPSVCRSKQDRKTSIQTRQLFNKAPRWQPDLLFVFVLSRWIEPTCSYSTEISSWLFGFFPLQLRVYLRSWFLEPVIARTEKMGQVNEKKLLIWNTRKSTMQLLTKPFLFAWVRYFSN